MQSSQQLIDLILPLSEILNAQRIWMGQTYFLNAMFRKTKKEWVIENGYLREKGSSHNNEVVVPLCVATFIDQYDNAKLDLTTNHQLVFYV